MHLIMKSYWNKYDFILKLILNNKKKKTEIPHINPFFSVTRQIPEYSCSSVYNAALFNDYYIPHISTSMHLFIRLSSLYTLHNDPFLRHKLPPLQLYPNTPLPQYPVTPIPRYPNGPPHTSTRDLLQGG